MKVGDTVLSNTATTGAVLFDTGCSANHFSPDIRNEFNAQMKKFAYKTYLGINWWPCSKEDMPKYPNISLSVNGLRIDVTSWSYFDFPTQQSFVILGEENSPNQFIERLSLLPSSYERLFVWSQHSW